MKNDSSNSNSGPIPAVGPITEIGSTQNPVFRELLALNEGKGQGILVHGLKLVDELIENVSQSSAEADSGFSLMTLVARGSFDLNQSKVGSNLFRRRFAAPVTRIKLADNLFDRIDPFGVPDVLAVFSRPKVDEWPSTAIVGPTLILSTQNPLNLGACMRSAHAFGIKNLVTLKESANPFNAKVIRSSMGAVFHMRQFRGPSIHDLAPPKNTPLLVLDLKGQDISKFDFPKDPVFLIGEEGAGVPEHLQGDGLVRLNIPMTTGFDSLNAAVSCGIALYAWSTRKTGIN